MYIAKLKDGPKRVKKFLSMILERVFSNGMMKIGTRFVALNATKAATTDEDVKRIYVLRI
jgi:hypothetical protein